MSKLREVWEYKTLTEVVQQLSRREADENSRHLAIGAGIVLGSRNAYQKQSHYSANQIRDQAEEAGLIAEKILELAGNQAVPKEALKEIAALQGERKRLSWSRPYSIFREIQPYSPEKLRAVGNYVENRLLGQNNLKQFHKFREKLKQKRKGLEYEVCKGNRLMEEKGLLTGYLIDYFEHGY